MKYIDQDNPRFTYYIRKTLNGFAIQVLNVQRDERFPLTRGIANQLGLALPDGFRCHCSANEHDELVAQLKSLADLNGLIEIE